MTWNAFSVSSYIIWEFPRENDISKSKEEEKKTLKDSYDDDDMAGRDKGLTARISLTSSPLTMHHSPNLFEV